MQTVQSHISLRELFAQQAHVYITLSSFSDTNKDETYRTSIKNERLGRLLSHCCRYHSNGVISGTGRKLLVLMKRWA